MNTIKISKAAIMLATLIITNTLATTAIASGSFNPSSPSGLQNPYNLGKQIFHKKIACDTCPLPSKNLNKDSAAKVIQTLSTRKDLIKLLKPKERKAAIYYLKKRYKVS